MGTQLFTHMEVLNLIIIILNAFKYVHPTEKTIYTYDINLPTAFNANLRSTTANISVYPTTQVIIAEIRDIPFLSLGGITRMDFANRLLLIRSNDGSRCAVYKQFPNLSFAEMENKLKIAPVNTGRIQDLVCAVSAFGKADLEHPQEVNNFCNPNKDSDSMITTFKNCKLYNPDDSDQHTVSFCLRSGIQDHNGLSCNRGGLDI